MLYPLRNKYRHLVDLSGFWDFRFDPDADDRDFLGPAWYQLIFMNPWDREKMKTFLRFGSVNYLSDVWLNGELIGHHEGGHLPFEFDISNKILSEDNLLVVKVDGRLSDKHVPPSGGPMNNPQTNFDFYPFCGIHRPVLLYAMCAGVNNLW